MLLRNINLPSRKKLRVAVKSVLREVLYPMDYTQLTNAALQRLAWSGTSKERTKIKEDVREQILEAGMDDLGYARQRGNYLGVIRDWYSTQQTLFTTDRLIVPISIADAEKAFFESVRRKPHMLNKHHKSDFDHFRTIYKGNKLEIAIAFWWQQNYSLFYQPPDNVDDDEAPCNHDFKLNFANVGFINRVWEIDVAGSGSSRMFGAVSQKPTATCHIIGKIDETGEKAEMLGFVSGEFFKKNRFYPEQSQSIERLIARANTYREGYDPSKIRRELKIQ